MLSRSSSICVDSCREAIASCEVCLAQADEGAKHAADLCHSSIRLCRLVVEELELNSMFSIQVCALCAVICRACAEECEMHAGAAWQDCAAGCLRAAAECHAIATSTRGNEPAALPAVKSRATP